MDTYKFFASYNFPGASVRDLWELEAPSFIDACIRAQDLSLAEQAENGEEEYLYNEFVQVLNV